MFENSQIAEAKVPPPEGMSEAFALMQVHRSFSGKMQEKLVHHSLNGKRGWENSDWSVADIKVEVARCLMADDFVSVANFAMFADFHMPQNAPATQLGLTQKAV